MHTLFLLNPAAGKADCTRTLPQQIAAAAAGAGLAAANEPRKLRRERVELIFISIFFLHRIRSEGLLPSADSKEPFPTWEREISSLLKVCPLKVVLTQTEPTTSKSETRLLF